MRDGQLPSVHGLITRRSRESPHRRIAERSSGLYAERSPSFRVRLRGFAIPVRPRRQINTGTPSAASSSSSRSSRASPRPERPRVPCSGCRPEPFSFVVVLVRVDSQRFFRARAKEPKPGTCSPPPPTRASGVWSRPTRGASIDPRDRPGPHPRDGTSGWRRASRPSRTPPRFPASPSRGRFLSEASGVRVVHAAEPVVIRHLVIVRQTRSTMLVAMSRAVFLAMVVVVVDGRPRARSRPVRRGFARFALARERRWWWSS